MDDYIKPYQQRLGLQNATFTRIDHEDGIVAIVYRVILSVERQYILKICPRKNDYLNEVYFLKNLTGLSVPRIFQNLQPEESIHGTILMECLPGKLLNKKDFNAPLFYDIGCQLARVHLHRTKGYGDLTRENQLETTGAHYFSSKFEEVFSECKNHLPKVIAEKCYHYYQGHISLLESVDGPCFAHRDFRPGNILVKDGKLQGIIDWSAARGGFAEEDFCPIEHGEWLMGTDEKNAFLAGYASVRPIPNYNAMMPLLRLCRALNVIGFTLKSDSWKGKNEKIYAFNYDFMNSFLTVE